MFNSFTSDEYLISLRVKEVAKTRTFLSVPDWLASLIAGSIPITWKEYFFLMILIEADVAELHATTNAFKL